MNMIGAPADPWTFTACIASHRCEISMKCGTDGIAQTRSPVFRVEDDVEHDVVKGLRHDMNRAFSPEFFGDGAWGGCPRLR